MGNSKSFGFGARLKKARQEKGMSGVELGLGAGENGKNASKQSVSDWEAERHYPKADQLRVICLKLNIAVDDLIFGDVKEHIKVIQAESAIQALTQEQRMALLAKMLGPAVTDARVEEFLPAPPAVSLHSDLGILESAPAPKTYRGKGIRPHHPAAKGSSKGRKQE
jgi:transcriptional regulator with XRE-family HTH domain